MLQNLHSNRTTEREYVSRYTLHPRHLWHLSGCRTIMKINHILPVEVESSTIWKTSTVKWGDLDLFLVYFMILNLCHHSTTWHSEYMTLPSLSWLEKHDFCWPSFLVFLRLQIWEVAISERSDLKLCWIKWIPVVPFFTAAIRGHQNYWSIKN